MPPSWTTELDYCPLAGSGPRPGYERKPGYFPLVLIPGRRLPASTTDAQAEHERALARAWWWTREGDGSVILWVEM